MMDAGDLAARVRTLAQMTGVVQAMRTLAASHQRRAHESFAGLERYAAAARAALAAALGLLSPEEQRPPAQAPSGPRLVIAFFSEHGFVGSLNERLLDAALRALEDGPARAELFALGTRGLRLCRERGVAAQSGGAMPTTVAGAGPTADRITRRVFDAIAEGAIASVDLVFSRHAGLCGWEPTRVRLFPPEVKAAEAVAWREPPLHTLPAPALVARLIEEHCFAQVTWAVGEAFASEHGARLAAMEASHRSVEEKLGELKQLERSQRQETITTEILEIAAGAGTLVGEAT
jgi:F-type H+-transporting ATPase subunit gamma